MKTERPKALLKLGLTLLLCIAFDHESLVHGMAIINSKNECSGKPFESLGCDPNNVIRVINAMFGYSPCYVYGGCCPQQDITKECYLSIPIENFEYYQIIMTSCNNQVQCSLNASYTDTDVNCSGSLHEKSDFVKVDYYCLTSSKTMKTETLCRNSSNDSVSTTLSCAENESIAFVGAILGFQDSAEESCRPSEDRCRIQPDVSHLSCIESACHGRQNCTVYAAADPAADYDTCSDFVYMYENITYYCDDAQPASPVNQVEPGCWSLSSTTQATTTIQAATTTTQAATTTTKSTSDDTFTTTTLGQITNVDVSQATFNDSTTAEPEPVDEVDDNQDVIIGASIACALVIMSLIAGIAAMIFRKRGISIESHHDNMKPDMERSVPYAVMEHEGETNNQSDPQMMSAQTGGHTVNQAHPNGDVISSNGVAKVPRDNMGLPNGRMNINSDKKNGTNNEDDDDNAANVKLTRIRYSVDDGYGYVLP